MSSRACRLLWVLVVMLAGTLGVGVVLVWVRDFQIVSARSQLSSRGIACDIRTDNDWVERLPWGQTLGRVFGGKTTIRCTPKTSKGTKLTDSAWIASLPLLQKMPSVEGIYLFDAQIGRQTLATCSQFPALEAICVAECDLGDEDMGALVSNRNLLSLDLSGTRVTGTGLRTLQVLPRLHQLIVDGAPITEEGLDAIATLTTLHDISMSNVGLAESEIMRLEESLPDVMISDD